MAEDGRSLQKLGGRSVGRDDGRARVHSVSLKCLNRFWCGVSWAAARG